MQSFYNRVFRLSHIFPTMIALMLIISGCSKSNEDSTLELLATVPADAEMVSVVNLNTLVIQTGGKVKDNVITQADNLAKAISDMSAKDSPAAKMSKILLSPESGIEASSMVAFTTGGSAYAICLIDDETKLTNTIDKYFPGEWTASGKMKVKDYFAIRQDRFWISYARTPEQAEKFSNLSEVESFRKNEYAATISAATDALSAWGSIDGLMKTARLSFSQQTTARMALGMFFNSPKSVAVAANVDKDWLKTQLRILDANLKPAKCELAVSKIDTKLVADLGGNANFIAAAAVSQKLIKQIMDLASSFGGEMPSAYASAIEPVDGTIAFAATLDPKTLPTFTGLGFKGALQTSGKNNARLLQVLEPLVGKITIEGNTFLFGNEGYGSGVAPLTDVAKDFDGAWIGVAGAMMFSDQPPYHYFAATLTPADNSLILNCKINLK